MLLESGALSPQSQLWAEDTGLGTAVLFETSRPHARLCYSPPQEQLLQALAGGEGFSSEHVTHDDLQATGHKGQHGIRLQGATAGHQAEALQRRALAQRLEELSVGVEVGLLQPAERRA